MINNQLSIDEFDLKVKAFTNSGVAEIIKHSIHSYSFRISTQWYEVSYYNDYGFNLNLFKGETITSTTELLFSSVKLPNGSQLRKKGDVIFDYLERIYTSQLVFQNEKITNSLKKFIQLIAICKSIEKLSENVFVLDINGDKYVFERNDKYNYANGIVSPLIEVKCNTNSKPINKIIEEFDKIDAIMAVLNSIYFLNKVASNQIVEKDLLMIFDLP